MTVLTPGDVGFDAPLLVVPAIDGELWPTLGPQVCDFIEAYWVHGPGDLRGKKITLDQETRAWIYAAYEVYPRVHLRAGRRRFKRVAWSIRKGGAKTEKAAWIAGVELDPDGPVRCIGWDGDRPIGGPVTDPYIPMIAYTEEQSEELAYGALLAIIRDSPRLRYFDAGEERIKRKTGEGKAIALASAPDSTDGARTTFQHFDETHRFTTPKLRNAHRTMMANIPKRKLADAWSLETTTAPAPGENSVAEKTMQYAKSVAEGRRQDADLFFFHRQASTKHDLSAPAGVREAVIEASGPEIAKWSDIDSIVAQFFDPTADMAYLRRVWLNQLVRASDRAFDVQAWRRRIRTGYVVPKGARITLGFDGARREDSTALVATEISTGYQWPIGIWEKPLGPSGEKWEVPEALVNDAVAAAFEQYDVFRMYADPPYWETWVATWAGLYGEERVVRWYTNRWRKMADCIRAYNNAMLDGLPADAEAVDAESAKAVPVEDDERGGLSQSGDPALERHIGNAYRMTLTVRDEKGERLWVIQKERSDSPNKIDAAMAGALSWEARRDAITLGANVPPTEKWDGEVLVFT